MTNKTKSLLGQLAEVIEDKKRIQQNLDDLKFKEDSLRADLKTVMEDRGIKTQVDEESNYQATLVERTELTIVDEELLIKNLKHRGKLETCLRLDAAAVKKEHKSEPLAGMGEVSTSYVQIKEAA